MGNWKRGVFKTVHRFFTWLNRPLPIHYRMCENIFYDTRIKNIAKGATQMADVINQIQVDNFPLIARSHRNASYCARWRWAIPVVWSTNDDATTDVNVYELSTQNKNQIPIDWLFSPPGPGTQGGERKTLIHEAWLSSMNYVVYFCTCRFSSKWYLWRCIQQ